MISVGCDIERVDKFKGLELKKDKKFLEKIYSKGELEYCFSKSNSAESLAARFCAKESAIKALAQFEVRKLALKDIEVTIEGGYPMISVKCLENIGFSISMSHTSEYVIAFVLAEKK